MSTDRKIPEKCKSSCDKGVPLGGPSSIMHCLFYDFDGGFSNEQCIEKYYTTYGKCIDCMNTKYPGWSKKLSQHDKNNKF